MTPDEARLFLGLEEDFDRADVVAARRRALLRHHPDHGGSREMLERIDAAVALVMSAPAPSGPLPRRGVRRLVHDCPSFTIDVLPVEAFETLVLAAGALDADIADEDPPYLLEVLLRAPFAAWCRCEVVPEAGGSIVTLTSDVGDTEVLEILRDLWIDAINELQRP